MNNDGHVLTCLFCRKITSNRKRNKLMVSNIKEWNTNIEELCAFTDRAMKSIIKYKPNIMTIGRAEVFIKFVTYWSYLIESLTNRRSAIQHLSGKLIQIFPAIMLQNATDHKNNAHVLKERLDPHCLLYSIEIFESF